MACFSLIVLLETRSSPEIKVETTFDGIPEDNSGHKLAAKLKIAKALQQWIAIKLYASKVEQSGRFQAFFKR